MFKKLYPGLAGIFFALVIVCSVALIRWTKSTQTEWDKQIRVLTPPAPKLKLFTFGYDHLIADFLWMRVIQDIDYCEQKKCQRGWTFQMLDMITDLSPKYREPYSIGSLSLSLLSEDVEGASLLYAKAMAHFPKDWSYAYRAGYHAMVNEEKPEKAANLFKIAARNGAPAWVYSLATKNYLKAGRPQMAEFLYQTLKKEDLPPELLNRIKRRIETRNSGELVDPVEN